MPQFTGKSSSFFSLLRQEKLILTVFFVCSLCSTVARAKSLNINEWLSNNASFVGSKFFYDALRNQPELDWGASTAETLSAPYLPGTYHLRIADRAGRAALECDLRNDGSPKLFNLSSENIQLGMRILERLLDAANEAASPSVNAIGNEALKKLIFWNLKHHQLSMIELANGNIGTDVNSHFVFPDRDAQESFHRVIPGRSILERIIEGLGTPAPQPVQYYRFRFPPNRSQVQVLHEKAPYLDPEHGVTFIDSSSSSTSPFIVDFHGVPKIQVYFADFRPIAKALETIDVDYLNHMLSLIYPGGTRADFTEPFETDNVYFSLPLPLQCSQVLAELRKALKKE